MKDKQAKAATPAHEIPLISPLLHFFSMPVIVFWRSNFGYSYLRPKSVFLASTVACFVFARIVHESPSLVRFEKLTTFLAVAASLYWLHLLRSFWQESRSRASHDQYSGTSHLLRLAPQTTVAQNSKLHRYTTWLFEPGFTIVAGLLIENRFDAKLGSLLCWMGICLFFKESIRAWLSVRRTKRQSDILEDAEESTLPNSSSSPARPIRSTRKPRTRRQRNQSSEVDLQQNRFAEILRLMPPYTLEDAERNFRILIKETHPDQAGESPEAELRTRELTEAVEYFRAKLG